MATADAPDGEPGASQRPVFQDGFYGILAACGGVAAGGRKHRGDAQLIKTDREDEDAAQHRG